MKKIVLIVICFLLVFSCTSCGQKIYKGRGNYPKESHYSEYIKRMKEEAENKKKEEEKKKAEKKPVVIVIKPEVKVEEETKQEESETVIEETVVPETNAENIASEPVTPPVETNQASE